MVPADFSPPPMAEHAPCALQVGEDVLNVKSIRVEAAVELPFFVAVRRHEPGDEALALVGRVAAAKLARPKQGLPS